MIMSYSKMSYGFSDSLQTNGADHLTGWVLFLAGSVVVVVVTLFLYLVWERSSHSECCEQEKLDALSNELGMYDPTTAMHSRRVAELARVLMGEVGASKVEQRVSWIAAQVHDVGKTAIASEVLSKPAPLTEEEWDLMRAHPELGAQMLERQGFCSAVVKIVRYHHERWDGGGYPAGLIGRQIPIGARVLAVVDGFDAMTSDRPYRRAMRLDEAAHNLRDGSGTQWDPEVVEAFLRMAIPPLYLEARPVADAVAYSGRSGRRMSTGVRSLTRSTTYGGKLAG